MESWDPDTGQANTRVGNGAVWCGGARLGRTVGPPGPRPALRVGSQLEKTTGTSGTTSKSHFWQLGQASVFTDTERLQPREESPAHPTASIM